MNLQQIQVIYQAFDDRVLVKLAFSESQEDGQELKQEVHVHFTRRFTMQFWPALMDAMNQQVKVNQPHTSHVADDVVAMNHEEAVQSVSEQGGFSKDFDSEASAWPLGSTPLIPTTINFYTGKEVAIKLGFEFQASARIEISLPDALLHAFCKLFKDAVESADWGFIVELPGALPALEDETPRWLN